MKKFYFIAAMVSVALTSCMNDEYVGDPPTTGEATTDAINFGSGLKAVTRTDITGSDAATKLGNAFKVYGVKQDRTTHTNYNTVFKDYSVKYSTAQASNDEYNNGWYYVGAETGQTIKYWDYSSADYHFVAGSPVANFTYALKDGTGDIEKATITGLGGRLNHSTTVASNATLVYIADPVVMTKPTPAGTKYGEVIFTFKSMQSKVRVGIYETIPGYKITSIQFYNNESTPVASNYITLNSATAGYFQGGTSTTGTVTYDWTATPAAYSFTYDSGITPGNYWEGGQFTAGVPANTSTATNLYGSDTNMASDGYFIVMPTAATTTAAPLTIKCDYTLKALDGISGKEETIEVKGAKATIPADYTKWAANTAYTYLFKISDNTNGSTGEPGTDPEGLYPITFDAVVVNTADANQNVGTETTVSTPSITVYQDGDVVANGITYVAGTVAVHAFEGTTDVTSTATWSYVELASYTHGTDYEKLGASGAATSWTGGQLTTVAAGKTYIIKAVTSNGTAYFVLVVGAAETGPANS